MKNLAIIMSGGTGSRMNSGVPKQLIKYGGRTLLEMSVRKFNSHPGIDTIFIVSHSDLLSVTADIVKKNGFFKVSKIIPGGSTRQLSSRLGVSAAEQDHERVLIHDSARPFVSSEVISRVLSALDSGDAVTPVISSSDTLVTVDHGGHLSKYLKRENIKRVQTPQGFKLDTILTAHIEAEKLAMDSFTDDCSMVLYFGLSEIILIDGDSRNIKITYKEDLDGVKNKR